jgi:hypothetical protein
MTVTKALTSNHRKTMSSPEKVAFNPGIGIESDIVARRESESLRTVSVVSFTSLKADWGSWSLSEDAARLSGYVLGE